MQTSEPITVERLRMLLKRSRAQLDEREAAIEASSARLATVAAAGVVMDLVLGKPPRDTTRARERDIYRAAILLSAARREVDTQRATCEQLERQLAALLEARRTHTPAQRSPARSRSNRRRRR